MAITHSFHNPRAERALYPKVGAGSTKAVATSVVHEDLHPGVYTAFVGCWAALLAVFLGTFAESPFTLFMLAVVIFYSIIFFGVPYVMSRVAPAKPRTAAVSLVEFLRGKVDTLMGPISGMEALTQVLMVPVMLTLGALVISSIIHFEADHIHMLYIGQTGPYPQ